MSGAGAALRLENTGERLAAYDALMAELAGSKAIATGLPNLMRSIPRAEDAFARCAMLDLSLQLRAHKRARGAYPESLSELAEETTDPLPGDVYSVGSFRYAREGEGFALSSPGAPWAGGSEGDGTLVCRFER